MPKDNWRKNSKNFAKQDIKEGLKTFWYGIKGYVFYTFITHKRYLKEWERLDEKN